MEIPLHKAVREADSAAVRKLIEGSANVNERNDQGATALHLAVKDQNKMVIQILKDCGADINAKTKLGGTPLHWAVLGDYKLGVTLLISYGANVDAADVDWMTPLFWAVIKGYDSIAFKLVYEQASINIKNKIVGKTPLHYAAVSGNFNMVMFLVDHGARIDEPSTAGLTAIQYAQGFPDIVKWLTNKIQSPY